MSKFVSDLDISLVVTSYRQLPFLRQALASALSQTKPFFQVIVVDDASNDETIPFLQDWEAQHHNAKVVFHAENSGQGIARNSGLDQITGGYVMFLDGDDVLLPNACETLTALIQDDRPDIALFNMTYVESQGDGVVPTQPRKRIYKADPCEGITFPRNMCPPSPKQLSLLAWRHPAAWLKLHRFAFLEDLSLRFNGLIYEDVLWHFQTLYQARSLSYITDELVLYRQHPNSIISTPSERHVHIIDQYEAIDAFMAGAGIIDHDLIETFRKHRFMQLSLIAVMTPRIPDALKSSYARRVLALPNYTDFDLGSDQRDLVQKLQRLAKG